MKGNKSTLMERKTDKVHSLTGRSAEIESHEDFKVEFVA